MNIKLAKACRIARMPPMAEREILASIPAEMIESLTGKQLAMVIVALNVHWHKACAWKERDILGDGVIWDDSAQQLREIAPSVPASEYAAKQWGA